MKRILFVCLGNICRSPMAEGLARHRITIHGMNAEVDSAGTAAYHVGEAADPRTLALLRRAGIHYDGRSRQVCREDFERFELILAMDRSNLQNLKKVCPPQHLHKLHLMLEPTTGGEVPDPYYGGPSGFENNQAQLEEALESWLPF